VRIERGTQLEAAARRYSLHCVMSSPQDVSVAASHSTASAVLCELHRRTVALRMPMRFRHLFLST
jgi:hypothetical protein